MLEPVMKMKCLTIFWCLCICFNVQASNMCKLGENTLEEEHDWLSRLDREFKSELNDVKEIAALNKIPSLILPIREQTFVPEHWEGLWEAVNNKEDLPLSAKRMSQLENVFERQALWQAAKNGGRALSAVFDIVLFAPWIEKLTRTMWDDSASDLHRLSVTAEPIPFIGFAIGYYDYLSTLDSPEKRFNQWLENGRYSYGQDSILLRINTASAQAIEQQHQQLKLHVNELVERLASIQLLHYDATYSAKVLELQTVLNRTMSAIDIDHVNIMFEQYNRPSHVVNKFGDLACINEKQSLKSEVERLGISSVETRHALRKCSYQMLMGNVGSLYGIGKYRHIEQIRETIFDHKQKIVDNALAHIVQWRSKLLELKNSSIEKLIDDSLNNENIGLYRQYLYQHARRIAINNFALSILQREATEEEQQTGRFLVGAGDLICGLYTCQYYDGKEVFFDESSDPLLKQLSEPLFTKDMHHYISERISHGWTNDELDEPYLNLWIQWQKRQDIGFSALPYKGNPSLVVIRRDMPDLVEILEQIPVHLSAQQAKPHLFRLIQSRMFKEDIQVAWAKLGDFIFRFQYEQRQHQSINFLPLQWQQAVWPSQPHGVLFNAFLDKSYLYYSNQLWAQALPYWHKRHTSFNWTLYQGETHSYYLTQSVPEEVYLGDQYWIEINESLSHVLSSPEIRWRPFEHMLLLDIWSQITEIESLIATSNG